MRIRLLPCGERAVLIEVEDLDAVLALRAAIAERVRGAGDLAALSATQLQAAQEPGGAPPESEPAIEVELGYGMDTDDDEPNAPADEARPSPDSDETPAGSVWANVVDILPAARTVLVGVDEPAALPLLRHELVDLAESVTPDTGEHSPHVITVPVVYDGPDLHEVAQLTGLSPQEVVQAHTGREWRVAFGGFAPGFPYLVGGDERLEVPRRDEPRTKVPAGSVGLAGTFSGIYPRSSPGGWQLIGRTQEVLWDERRDPPALLQPGWGVQFQAVDAPVSGVEDGADGPADDGTAEGAAAQSTDESTDDRTAGGGS